MSQPIRMAILGCARIARRAVIAGIRGARGAELVAIASRQPGLAAAWAAEFGIPKHFDSYEAMLADPQIDAVYNPLPNELHRPWSLQAAAAGKHVLCEKPLGIDYEDALATVEGCRQAGVILMEAFMWRHHPRVAKALAMLAAGELGQLRLIKMDFSFQIDRSDWRLEPARGGGALYDLGCYGINAARLFTGQEPGEIVARARRYESGVDMTTGMLLRFPSDAVALLDASFEAPRRIRLELVGTKASLEFPDGVLPLPQSVLLVRRGQEVETIEFPVADQYALEIEAFCEGIRTGRLPYPAEDGLANMKALSLARSQACSW